MGASTESCEEEGMTPLVHQGIKQYCFNDAFIGAHKCKCPGQSMGPSPHDTITSIKYPSAICEYLLKRDAPISFSCEIYNYMSLDDGKL